MKMTKKKITPLIAAKWLERNINNRPLSMATVRKYSEIMERGEWRLNGDSIRFNTNGDLIDGQHRLSACLASGVSFETYVCEGLEHEAFDTIDQGKKRAIADVFARMKFKHYTTLAGAVSLIYRHNQRTTSGCPTADQAIAIIEKHDGLHESSSLARKLRDSKLIVPSSLAFLIYGSSLDDKEASVEFWTSIMTSIGIKQKTVASLLHQRLISNLSSTAKLPSSAVVNLGIKAWNSHISPGNLKCLKIVDGEEAPKFKTLLSMKGE